MTTLESSNPVAIRYLSGLKKLSWWTMLSNFIVSSLIAVGYVSHSRPAMGLAVAILLASIMHLTTTVLLLITIPMVKKLTYVKPRELPGNDVLLIALAVALAGIALGILGLVMT